MSKKKDEEILETSLPKKNEFSGTKGNLVVDTLEEGEFAEEVIQVEEEVEAIPIKNPPIEKEDLIATVNKSKVPVVDKSMVRVKFLKDCPAVFIICGRVEGKKGDLKMIKHEQANILRKRNYVT